MFILKAHEFTKKAAFSGSEFLAQIAFNILLGFQKVCDTSALSRTHFLHPSSANYLVANIVGFIGTGVGTEIGGLVQTLVDLLTFFSHIHLVYPSLAIARNTLE